MKHHLTYVVGRDLYRALALGGVKWDEYVIGGRWSHLSRLPRHELPLPDYLLYEDGRWLSKRDGGKEAMREAFEALTPADPITVVDRLG